MYPINYFKFFNCVRLDYQIVDNMFVIKSNIEIKYFSFLDDHHCDDTT